MRRPLQRLALLPVVIFVFGCADRRPPVAQEHLREAIATQSGGALALASMTKTNGFDHEREGIKMHTIEWEATLLVNADGWKAGWANFQVLKVPPNAFAAAIEGASVRRLLRGGKAALQGKSVLQKADNGWRVLNSEVTAFKIAAPPDNPNEGRSTDIQAFWNAFKQALATKNTQAVAKFARFPLRIQGTPMVQESEFHSKPPWGDAQLQPLLDAVSPTKTDERRYQVSALQFSVYFEKDRDGYWKWTSYDYGSQVMDEVETPEDAVQPTR